MSPRECSTRPGWLAPWAVLVASVLALAGCAQSTEPVITIPAGPDTTVTPPVPAGTVSDGTHEVLTDVQAGRYRTAGPREGGVGFCFWYRLSGTSGQLGDIIASGQIYGPTTVTIAPGDRAFRTEFCRPWTRIGDAP